MALAWTGGPYRKDIASPVVLNWAAIHPASLKLLFCLVRSDSAFSGDTPRSGADRANFDTWGIRRGIASVANAVGDAFSPFWSVISQML